MDTNVIQLPNGKIVVDAEIHNQLERYVQADLRRRFDNYDCNLNAIAIIEDTRNTFGFKELSEEMISDFCLDDDAAALWRMHEYDRKVEERGEQLFELSQENI